MYANNYLGTTFQDGFIWLDVSETDFRAFHFFYASDGKDSGQIELAM